MLQAVDFKPGDIVRVHQRIQEGEKSRVQIFEGTVLSVQGRGDGKNFRVQKIEQGIGIERIWQLKSPNLVKVDIIGKIKGTVRRAKLNYLRVPKK